MSSYFTLRDFVVRNKMACRLNRMAVVAACAAISSCKGTYFMAPLRQRMAKKTKYPVHNKRPGCGDQDVEYIDVVPVAVGNMDKTRDLVPGPTVPWRTVSVQSESTFGRKVICGFWPPHFKSLTHGNLMKPFKILALGGSDRKRAGQ
jgi:hypothetical protein